MQEIIVEEVGRKQETMGEQIMVSVICAAYNHGRFIRKALDGFVMQKTDFPFEILIHDDASTDDTADIIREYEKKYPELIKPIYQTENKYSQGISINKTYLYPKAKGKYFAMCEGDDYWIDENKLQRQVDFLESHPDFTLCAHNSKRYYVKQDRYEVENPVLQEGEVSARDMLLEPRHRWMATASLLYRREYAFDRPELFSICPVGDYALRSYCFSQGKVYYLEKPMSVYRYEVENSWMQKYRRNIDLKIDAQYRMWKFIKAYDDYTGRKYHKLLKKKYQKHKAKYLKLLDDYPRVKNNPYFRRQSRRFRFGRWMNYYCPGLYNLLKKAKPKSRQAG